jgi:H+/Cl- antiporter ClcA
VAIIAGTIGFFAGIAFHLMRRAWSDWQKVKGSVPGLRKDAMSRVGQFLKWAVIMAVGVVLLGAWIVGDLNRQAGPGTRPAQISTPGPHRT